MVSTKPAVGQMDAKHALTVLTRLADRRPDQASKLRTALRGRLSSLGPLAIDVAIQTGDPIGRVLANELSRSGSPAIAAKLSRLLPQRTLSLRELRLVVQQRRLETLIGSDDRIRQERAAQLSNVAKAYHELGLHDEALAAVEEAVQLYRALLAEKQSDILRAGLATTLVHLANCCGTAARIDGGLSAAVEAVALLERLVSKDPNYRNDLALALQAWGNCLSQLQRHSDALTAKLTALDLYRTEALAHPGTYRDEIAHLHNNVSVTLDDLGRYEHALLHARECVDVLQPLADTYPDAYLVDLVRALDTLSRAYSKVALFEEALIAAQRRVDALRKLAATRPSVFRPALASALRVLATRSAQLGQFEKAAVPAGEAVALQRDLTRASEPDNELAGYLQTLSRIFHELSRDQEAASAIDEVVQLRRALTTSNKLFEHDLAMALYNAVPILQRVHRMTEALGAAQEAVAICRRLVTENRGGVEPLLAIALNQLAACLGERQRWQEAFDVAEEATRLLSPHFAAEPRANLDSMEHIIAIYIICAQESGRGLNAALLASARSVRAMLGDMPGREIDNKIWRSVNALLGGQPPLPPTRFASHPSEVSTD